MTWFKVDDSFYDHPKVFDAPDCALALWVRAGCWSARNLNDGFVPASLPARLCDDPDTAVRELVDRGLWKRARGGFQFHDWLEYQPSAADVKDLRRKRAEAGKKGGQAKAAKQAATKPVASANGVAKQNAAPSRPVPSRRDGGSVGDTGTGDQSVRARELAQDAQGARWLRGQYPGLTDFVVSFVISQARARAELAGRPIEQLVPYLRAMQQPDRGQDEADLADVIAAGMDAEKARDLALAHIGGTPWCGKCDPDTRLTRDFDQPGRCPDCHPLRSTGGGSP